MTIEVAQSPEESTLKFAGRVIRNTLSRVSYAECTDEDCPQAWTGASAIVASGMHTVGTGHIVIQHYEAAYEIVPNPKGTDFKPMGGARQKADRASKRLKELAAQKL